uniref:Uncharacterized protein n=1 Tax=Arundo donax TaxID=35708 RepID=A0A0A9FBD7_ARUDO
MKFAALEPAEVDLILGSSFMGNAYLMLMFCRLSERHILFFPHLIIRFT